MRKKNSFFPIFLKLVNFVICAFVVFITTLFLYYKLTYIEGKFVTEGEAFGLKIGDSKKTTFVKITKLFAKKKVLVTLSPPTLFRSKVLVESDYDLFKKYNTWHLLVKKPFKWPFIYNFSIFIEGDELRAFRIHRKAFELP